MANLDNAAAEQGKQRFVQTAAERLAGDARSATYQFALSVAGTALLNGRLTVLLQAEQEGFKPK